MTQLRVLQLTFIANFITIVLLLKVNGNICFEDFPTSRTPAANQTKAVKDLIKRLIPERADEFVIEVDPGLGITNSDSVKIEAFEKNIKISGSSGVAAAWGFHHYLKYFCQCHISWSGNQLHLPETLPTTGLPLTLTANDRFRYYQNVCTASYTMVWWNWTRWEQEIDWMALNGINLPLAFNGQEGIWQKVFLSLGFLQDEIDDFFTGPAFLAWNRMGNIQKWGGPLPPSWHLQQNELQHRILQRMREFGMMPVLPAFSGHVPSTITRLFPNVSTTISQWGKFKFPYSTTFLEPQDPLFRKIGSAFVKEYISEFGTDHFYNTDLFNEMRPNSSDPNYLKLCGKTLFESLTSVDSNAIWIMQGWLFANDEEFWKIPQAEALLTSVPIGKMIVLDLQSEVNPQFERLNWYFGQPFIWCMLHNFGGVLGLYGTFDNINKGPILSRSNPNSTMIGIGLSPEGIEQNYVMYDFMMEMSWRNESVDPDKWIEEYSIRRYGIRSEYLIEGWKLLIRSVYNASNDIRNHGKYTFIRRPSLKLKPLVWYDPRDVFSSWYYFVNASNDLSLAWKVEPFRYDLVDVTRQSLQLIFDSLYLKAVKSFRRHSLPKLRIYSNLMLSLLQDLDNILASDEHFLLGSWLKAAKSLGTTKVETSLYEFNARNQITLWGPSGEILDYGNKQWSGLISGYYFQRWKLFLASLEESLHEGTMFNQTRYEELVFEFYEKAFTYGQEVYPPYPKGDSVTIAKQLIDKYKIWTIGSRLPQFRILKQRQSQLASERTLKDSSKNLHEVSNILIKM